MSDNTVFVAARLAKATRSKAYLLQRPGRFAQEQWMVGSAETGRASCRERV